MRVGTLNVGKFIIGCALVLALGVVVFRLSDQQHRPSATAVLFVSPVLPENSVGSSASSQAKRRASALDATADLARSDAVRSAASRQAALATPLNRRLIRTSVDPGAGTVNLTAAATDSDDAVALADALADAVVASLPESVGHAAVSSPALPDPDAPATPWWLVGGVALAGAASGLAGIRRGTDQRTVAPSVG